MISRKTIARLQALILSGLFLGMVVLIYLGLSGQLHP